MHYDDPTTPPPHFSLHQIYMTNSDIPHQTSHLYTVQPTSHTSETRIFPSLPFTSENLKFINKFNFQFSDLTDTEYITLCKMLLKYKTCHATHKNDVGKISTPIRIILKPNAQLLTQRPSKVPIHYRDKLNALLKELEKYNPHKTNRFLSTRQTSLWYHLVKSSHHNPQRRHYKMCIRRSTP